jgi:23S rRNA (uracil1939-C5)-methyltransferase
VGDETVTVTSVAVGGAGVGRWPDGRVAFVAGALPGEVVEAAMGADHGRYVHAAVVRVHHASPDRRDVPCPHRRAGCGGCDWMHVSAEAQRRLKAALVEEVLQRAGTGDVAVGTRVVPPNTGYRTTVRVAVDALGRPSFRAASSHELVPVDSCLVAAPAIAALLAEARFPPGRELTIRTSVATGELLVLAEPTAHDVDLRTGVLVVGADELAAGRRAWLHETAAGRSWRVSARSFFQVSPGAATALSDEVGAALGPWSGPGRLLDLYAGVGVFAATGAAITTAGAAGPGLDVVAVESSPAAVADARVNLAGTGARVVRVDVDRFRPPRADLVVADPSRRGLGRKGAAVVDRSRAGRLALVSCDAGALGRDAALLHAAGWRCVGAVVVDVFPDTSQVEVVTSWRR